VDAGTTEPLDENDRFWLSMHWGAIEDTLPSGWVFAGVIRNAGAPFLVDNSSLWIAVARLESPTELGPVPEMTGRGTTAPWALFDLSQRLLEMQESK